MKKQSDHNFIDNTHHHDNAHSHAHSTLKSVEQIIKNLNLDETIKNDVYNVYKIIADAESKAHQVPVDQVHFHEVGAKDAIMDIAAVCLLIRTINPDKIEASPVCIGSGYVRCAHGIVPVPAPATSFILEDIPHYKGDISAELCTPTGAALLKYFVDEFTEEPKITEEKIGYGIGKKKFDRPNRLKAVLGEDKEDDEKVVLLECNLDDITGEEIGYAAEKILESGALEVYTTPIYMKKNRPAFLLSVLCSFKDKEKIASLIFSLTPTIGIREFPCNRYRLKRYEYSFDTEYGPVREKVSTGYGTTRTKTEYEDIKKIADVTNKSISQIRELVEFLKRN